MTSKRTPRDQVPDEVPQLRPPRLLLVALAGVLGEVGALVVGAGWVVVELVAGRATRPGVSLFLTVLALGLAAVLVAAARALRRGSRRARGPIVTWQLLQAATGATFVGASGAPSAVPWLAAGAIALAVVVMAGVLSGPALRFTAD